MAWRETYPTKRGLKFRVRWRERGRRLSKKAGMLPSTANQIIKNIEDDISVQGTSSYSFKKVIGCYKEYIGVISKTLKPRTVAIAENSLKGFLEKFQNVPIHDIRPDEIEQFKNSLLQTRQVNGINIIIRNIKTFFNFCVKNGYASKNPASEIKQFKPVPVARFITRQEMIGLYYSSSKKLRSAIFIFYNTGMRLGEFLGIRPQDLGEHEVTITGKTGTRTIPIPPRVRRILVDQIGAWKRKGLEQAFRVASNGANLGRIRLHDLRHTWASACLQNGGTIADLQALGGWTSLKTLQIYVHLQKNHLADKMVRIRL